MTNLYNVDTTGRAYALDSAPLMKIDDKRVAIEGAKLQAVSDLAEQGAMAAETYTARKQLASLATSQQQLKPGTPEFERDVANLIQQHPLAFNNPFTAPAAKAGLSSLASAHAQALKSQDQTQQNNFTIERDKARFTAEKDIAETRYRKTQKAPLNLGDLVGDPSAAPAAAPSQNPSSDMPAGSGEAAPLPDGPGGTEDSLLNIPEPDLPPVPDGVEGPVGPKGPSGMPVAPAAVKVPDTKSPAIKKSDPVNLDNAITDSLAKAAKYEAAARALEQNDQHGEAAAARMKAIDFKAEAEKYKGSEEYQQKLQAKIKAQKDQADADELTARAPEISAELSGGFPELSDLHGEMDKEISGAKSKVELSRAQAKWRNKLETARQLMQVEGKIPDDPNKIEEVAIKRVAVIRAAQAADAAENEVGKYADKVKTGAPPDVVAYANKLKARRDAAQAKAKDAADQYDVLKTKVGMNEPEDTTDKGPKPDAGAKVEDKEDAYAARVGKTESTNKEPGIDEIKQSLAKDHPEVIDALEKIAKENPTMETYAIKQALAKFAQSDEDGNVWFDNGEAKKVFGNVFAKDAASPIKVAKDIVQDFRARMNAPKQSDKGWSFQQVK